MLLRRAWKSQFAHFWAILWSSSWLLSRKKGIANPNINVCSQISKSNCYTSFTAFSKFLTFQRWWEKRNKLVLGLHSQTTRLFGASMTHTNVLLCMMPKKTLMLCRKCQPQLLVRDWLVRNFMTNHDQKVVTEPDNRIKLGVEITSRRNKLVKNLSFL